MKIKDLRNCDPENKGVTGIDPASKGFSSLLKKREAQLVAVPPADFEFNLTISGYQAVSHSNAIPRDFIAFEMSCLENWGLDNFWA